MDLTSLRSATASALEALSADRIPVVAGFDGFVDQIIDVVGKRAGPDSYERIPTIAAYGERVCAAAGRSTNFELVVKQTKIGGNGPIMANALVQLGHPLTYIGILGDDQIHPAFQPLADGATELISLGPPAATDALEFDDGKLMLGKHESLGMVSVENLEQFIGPGRLRSLFAEAGLIATVNWTMLLEMTAIWEHLAANVLPGLRDDRPLWFVDLADPAKRSREDLHRALDVLSKLQEFADIILGVNEAEARQVIEVLGGSWKGGSEDLEAAEACCVELRQRLGLHRVVCHQVKGAAGAGPDGSAAVVGFFEPKPKITTGAGDHFNAGYSFSIAAGLDEAAALCAGTATSGFYVRTAKSPAVADLIAFCRS